MTDSSTHLVSELVYYTVSVSSEELGYIDEAPRKPFWSREKAIEAAKAFLTEHAAKYLYWPRGRDRGFDGEVRDERGNYIYPASGCDIDQRAVPATLRVETDATGAVVEASAEIEWREVRAYDKRIETVVDGHTFARTERVCEVVKDWQPLCSRRYGLLGDDITRTRAKTYAYVSEKRLSFADGVDDV